MKASDKQVGGDHYKDFPIQPGEFCVKNGLKGFPQSIVGRICRYDKPTGKGLEDLEKIKHEVDLIIEWEGWGEEKHWVSQIEKSMRQAEDVLRKDFDRKIWGEGFESAVKVAGEKPGFVRGMPQVRYCRCGRGPYMNWGNGLYWIECPSCHAVGVKSQLREAARDNWNEGDISYVEGI